MYGFQGLIRVEKVSFKRFFVKYDVLSMIWCSSKGAWYRGLHDENAVGTRYVMRLKKALGYVPLSSWGIATGLFFDYPDPCTAPQRRCEPAARRDFWDVGLFRVSC